MTSNYPSRTAFLPAIAVILIAAPFFAQTPGGTRPAFEVISIKPYVEPDGPGPFFGGIRNLPGSPRIDMTGVTFKMVMAYAYSLREFQIIGGPDWINTDQYDIQAKAEDGSIPPPATGFQSPTAPNPMAVRTQSMLDDRFQLKMHRESRDLPVYELELAKGGSKLEMATDQGPGPLPPDAARTGENLKRGSLSIRRTPEGWTLEAFAVPVSHLINAFSDMTGRPVVDRSGLKGLYDAKMKWAYNNLPAFGRNPNDANGPGLPPPVPDGPSIFDAVQEQLGLRLVSSKGPVQVFVIDAVQKPSAN